MIEPDRRKAIYLLHQGGMGMREIARRIGVSRNIVREIIREEGAVRALGRTDKICIDEELLKRLYEECDGWKQRIHEKLLEEEKVKGSYPTLTRRLRELVRGRQEKARFAREPVDRAQQYYHGAGVYIFDAG